MSQRNKTFWKKQQKQDLDTENSNAARKKRYQLSSNFTSGYTSEELKAGLKRSLAPIFIKQPYS